MLLYLDTPEFMVKTVLHQAKAQNNFWTVASHVDRPNKF